MHSLFLIFHVLAAIAIIGLVLVQHGKGADMGAAFGSGSAGSLFGSSGASNFLSKTTAVAATLFFLTSLALTYIGSGKFNKSAIERAAEKANATSVSKDAAKPDAKTDVKTDVKVEAPKADAVKSEPAKTDAPKEAPKAADIPK
jgi:preprotein translocase subunit SecG